MTMQLAFETVSPDASRLASRERGARIGVHFGAPPGSGGPAGPHFDSSVPCAGRTCAAPRRAWSLDDILTLGVLAVVTVLGAAMSVDVALGPVADRALQPVAGVVWAPVAPVAGPTGLHGIVIGGAALRAQRRPPAAGTRHPRAGCVVRPGSRLRHHSAPARSNLDSPEEPQWICPTTSRSNFRWTTAARRAAGRVPSRAGRHAVAVGRSARPSAGAAPRARARVARARRRADAGRWRLPRRGVCRRRRAHAARTRPRAGRARRPQLGAHVALAYAAAFPERVAGLFLADPAGDARKVPPAQAQALIAALESDAYATTIDRYYRALLVGSPRRSCSACSRTSPRPARHRDRRDARRARLRSARRARRLHRAEAGRRHLSRRAAVQPPSSRAGASQRPARRLRALAPARSTARVRPDPRRLAERHQPRAARGAGAREGVTPALARLRALRLHAMSDPLPEPAPTAAPPPDLPHRGEHADRLSLAVEVARLRHLGGDVVQDRVSWSIACTSCGGVERGAMGGRFADVVALLPPEGRARFESDIAAALAAGGEYASEMRLPRADGAPRWLATRARVGARRRRPRGADGGDGPRRHGADVAARREREAARRPSARAAASRSWRWRAPCSPARSSRRRRSRRSPR